MIRPWDQLVCQFHFAEKATPEHPAPAGDIGRAADGKHPAIRK